MITKLFLDEEIVEQFIELIELIQPKEWCLIQPHPANKKKNMMNMQQVIRNMRGSTEYSRENYGKVFL